MKENISALLGIVVMALCIGLILVLVAGCEVNTSNTATGGGAAPPPTEEVTPPEEEEK
jgi:hypothetical protein